jgi:uncharacterized protein (DUF1684 family)
MAKTKTTYFCQNCGTQTAQWMGQCKSCGEWNTIVEEIVDKGDEKKSWKDKSDKKEKTFAMKTTTSRTPLYVKYGELHFTIDGKDLKLNVYKNVDLSKKSGYKDYLFLPFSDLTCVKESYIGGRYVDMRMQKGKTWTIDFNKAYHPYCAYNYEYSCPIVPLENDLDIEINAGVKKFHD